MHEQFTDPEALALIEARRRRDRRVAVILTVAVHAVLLAIFAVVTVLPALVADRPIQGLVVAVEPVATPPPVRRQETARMMSPSTAAAPPSAALAQTITAMAPTRISAPSAVTPPPDAPVGLGAAAGLGVGAGAFGQHGHGAGRAAFFNARAQGRRFVFLFDTTWSGSRSVFVEHRDEWIRSIERLRQESPHLQYTMIFFGGRISSQLGASPDALNRLLTTDFRYPKSIRPGEWLTAGSPATDRLIEEMREISPGDRTRYATEGGTFILGTQYWGAIHEALSMNPPPDAIFLLVEPEVGFRGGLSGQFGQGIENYRRARGAELGRVPIHVIAGRGTRDDHSQHWVDAAAALNGTNARDPKVRDLLTFVRDRD